ncbi:hypothetical protein D3C80_2038990 [compost metagenome]
MLKNLSNPVRESPTIKLPGSLSIHEIDASPPLILSNLRTCFASEAVASESYKHSSPIK